MLAKNKSGVANTIDHDFQALSRALRTCSTASSLLEASATSLKNTYAEWFFKNSSLEALNATKNPTVSNEEYSRRIVEAEGARGKLVRELRNFDALQHKMQRILERNARIVAKFRRDLA